MIIYASASETWCITPSSVFYISSLISQRPSRRIHIIHRSWIDDSQFYYFNNNSVNFYRFALWRSYIHNLRNLRLNDVALSKATRNVATWDIWPESVKCRFSRDWWLENCKQRSVRENTSLIEQGRVSAFSKYTGWIDRMIQNGGMLLVAFLIFVNWEYVRDERQKDACTMLYRLSAVVLRSRIWCSMKIASGCIICRSSSLSPYPRGYFQMFLSTSNC